jgi:hypothetical protein
MTKYLLSVAMLITGIAVLAQTSNAEEMRVSVPHDFVVAGRLLQAGTYNVSRESASSSFRTLRLVNVEGKQSAVFVLPVTFESKASDEAKLTFEQSGDVYTLAAIQTGSGIYTLSPESNQVRMALKQVTARPGGR